MYKSAKKQYEKYGVDVEKALSKLSGIPIAIHCWQGDDVKGFDNEGSLSGGIQATGNYPGRARTPEELMQDMEKVFSLVPGKKKLNVHASYAIFKDGEKVDRDKLQPKHFKPWVDFAKKHGCGIHSSARYRTYAFVSRRRSKIVLGTPRSGLYQDCGILRS